MAALLGWLRCAPFVLLVVVSGATAPAGLADETATLAIEATTQGAEPGTGAVFTIKLSAATDSNTTVRVTTGAAEGADAATAGEDYESLTGTAVHLPKGATAAKVTVKVLDDPLDEAKEQFVVTLSDVQSSSGVRITPEGRTATGSIQDNDDPPAAKVANAPDVPEGNPGNAGKAVFTVSLSKKSGREVHVAFATRDSTAKAGEDYTARTGLLKIPAGDVSGTVVVDLVADTKVESAETFTLVITRQDETAVLGSPAEATAKVVDDDQAGGGGGGGPTSSLSVADASGQEGSAVTFRVTLAPAVQGPVSVKWATANGTATAGSDYTAGSGTLSFATSETSKTVSVALLADQQADGGETFFFNLSAPVGATLADGQAVGTILEQPAAAPGPPPALSVTDVSARESEGATFTLELSRTSSSRVSVMVSTSDGTAREGLDYLGRRATIEFAPGEKTKTIAVTVLDDDLAEPDETFSLGLGNPVNAEIAKSRGVATIESNDQAAGVAGLLPPTANLPLPAPPATAKTGTGKSVKATNARWPRMALWPLTVKVDPQGIARMTVLCKPKSPVACSGRVALETAAKPKFQLAVKSFVVRKGRQASLPLKLSPRARRLVAHEGKVRARVVVLVRVGAIYLRVFPGFITLDSATGSRSSQGHP